MGLRVVDVTDPAGFALLPACADPAFDHRTCDYWEDADRGSRAARPGWSAGPAPRPPRRAPNPFGDDPDDAGRPIANPFAPAATGGAAFNPFAPGGDDGPAENPFAPRPRERPRVGADAPRKLALLARGLGVFGSYAKVLLDGDETLAYAQFGPLSAYPRAQRTRELYPALPDAPLPAVITCVATTSAARRRGHALHLVAVICEDLAGRGFAAVEAYPEVGARLDATSAATPGFWLQAGFRVAAEDDRWPVLRREL